MNQFFKEFIVLLCKLMFRSSEYCLFASDTMLFYYLRIILKENHSFKKMII